MAIAPTSARNGARLLRRVSWRPKIFGPALSGLGRPPPCSVALVKASRPAVNSRIAPKMYSTQSNRFSAAAPAAMNTARSTRAMPMPSSSTRLRSSAGTAERPISRTKTNRLSRDRLYSVSQPA
jgi:hypothetical protein